MKSIASTSSAIFANLFKNYNSLGFKNMVAFYSTVQKFNWLFLWWSSQQSALWLDFKVESVL